MYTREIGLERLTKLQKELRATISDAEYQKGIYVDVPFRYFGVLPPGPEDVAAFNSCVPNFEHFNNQQEVCVLRSFGIKSKSHLATVDAMEGERICVEQAYHFANTFLISLSMASLSFAIWKQISLPGLTFQGSSLLKDRKIAFAFQPTDLQMTNHVLYPIHAGHLVMAYEVFSELVSWHHKFVACYSKGQILLNSPVYIDMNFWDEAYLNYFRCLEYLVMDKVLDKRGDLTDHKLADAFLELEFAIEGTVSKKSAYSLGKTLNARRGTAAAHLTRGNLGAAGLTAQEAYELKTLVDSLAVAYVNKFQIKKSAIQKALVLGLPPGNGSPDPSAK